MSWNYCANIEVRDQSKIGQLRTGKHPLNCLERQNEVAGDLLKLEQEITQEASCTLVPFFMPGAIVALSLQTVLRSVVPTALSTG